MNQEIPSEEKSGNNKRKRKIVDPNDERNIIYEESELQNGSSLVANKKNQPIKQINGVESKL